MARHRGRPHPHLQLHRQHQDQEEQGEVHASLTGAGNHVRMHYLDFDRQLQLALIKYSLFMFPPFFQGYQPHCALMYLHFFF